MRKPLSTGLMIADEKLLEEIRELLAGLPARVVFENPDPDFEQLRHMDIDLVLMDGRAGGQPIEEAVRRIKSVCRGAMITVVQADQDPELILAALRAGADEFVAPPLATGLRTTLERARARLRPQETSSDAAAKVVGVVSAKGGCGATTVACHVASALEALSRQRVLLADFDLDAGLAGFLMRAPSASSIFDPTQKVPLMDLNTWQRVAVHQRGRLDVMPAPSRASFQPGAQPRPFRDVFRHIRSTYGWVIADLGRGLSPVMAALLEDLDEVLVVTTVNVPAIYQARQLLRNLEQAGVPRTRVRLVLNRVTDPVHDAGDGVRAMLGAVVCAEIAEDPALDEAYAEGQLVDPTTAIGRDLAGLAARLAGLPSPRRSRWPWLASWRRAAAG